MTTMTVSQLSVRTGLSASTLRYYEDRGLLAPERRANGYRAYDEDAVDRLRFVAAAKSLAIDLDTIASLVGTWESASCASLRSRLRPAVEQRLSAARTTRDHAERLVEELRRSLDHLDRLPDRAEPCDPVCGFLAEPEEPAVACSLGADDHAERLAAWHALLAGVEVSRDVDAATVTLPAARAADALDLARRELGCCPFFGFHLEVRADAVDLRITVPADGGALLDDLLGPAGDER